MMEVRVTLDFECCHCKEPVCVTVQCAGPLPADARRIVAAVSVPCPECKRVNQLYFDPSGTIHAVEPYCQPRPVPEPSLN
jgi:phage FluMu protein Com